MTFAPKNAVVWAEIPVTDIDKAMAFYAALIGAPLTRDDTGANPMAMFACADPKHGTAGHIYPGTPCENGPTVHLAVSGTAEEAAERCKSAGGTIVSPVIEIPAGRFIYARDPDGNSIGLFQAA